MLFTIDTPYSSIGALEEHHELFLLNETNAPAYSCNTSVFIQTFDRVAHSLTLKARLTLDDKIKLYMIHFDKSQPSTLIHFARVTFRGVILVGLLETS